MAIVPMEKVALVGFKEDLAEIGKSLVWGKVMEPVNIQPYLEDEQLSEKLAWNHENPYGNLESRLLTLMDLLGMDPEEAANMEEKPSLIEIKRIDKRLHHIEQRIQPLVAQKETITKRKAALVEMEQAVIRIQGLKLPIQQIRQMKYVSRILGKIDKMSFTRLLEGVEELPVVIVRTWEDENNLWFLAFYSPNDQEIFMKILDSLGGEILEIPHKFTGTPDVVLHKIRKRMEYADMQLEEIDLRIRQVGFVYKNKIKRMYLQVSALSQVYARKGELAFSENLFIIHGWIPKNRIEALDQKVLKDFPMVVKIEEEGKEVAREEEPPPTLLENKRFFRPFEMIVKMYGIPDYAEIDPTPLVAITFILMFGIMFGDVGQGLIIALGGFLLYRGGTRDGGAILGTVGIVSTLFGFLYGSVFGFEDVIPAMWMRPMSHIQTFLFLAVAFGVTFILLGMVLNVVNGIKENNFERIFMDRNGILGLAFYVLLLVFGYGIIAGNPILPTSVFVTLEIVILLLMAFKGLILRMIGRGPKHQEGAVEAFFEIFDTIVSFLSNTISFIRVGAFALNHVGLFMAVFLIAKMLQHGRGESLGGWLVIIIGNIVIIGLEGLIVGIQALRLEYYEFFSKFYRGNGRAFQPMAISKRK